MTKTNEQTKVATKSRKVIGEKDIAINGKRQTRKELDAETEADLRKISAETGAPRARTLEAAKLANGLTARAAPHSAKAVSDKAAKAKASNKADKVQAKGKVAAAKKAAAKSRPANADRKYKWIGENKAREGTWRHAMLACAEKNTSKSAGDACMAKSREFSSHKMDWRWMAAQGYIKWID